MRKQLFLLGLFLCVYSLANAQRDQHVTVTQVNSKNALFLGPKIGVTMSNLSQSDVAKIYDGIGVGFSAGLAAQIRLGKAMLNAPGGTGLMGLEFEISYKQNKVKTVGIDDSGTENAKFGINYLEIPVLLQIYPFYKSSSLNSFHVEVGASFARALSNSPKYLRLPNGQKSYEQEVVEATQITTYTLFQRNYLQFDFDTDRIKMKGNDIRVLLGLGYTVPGTELGINARYYIGTSRVIGNWSSKMQTFEASLSWMFNAAKF